MARLLKQLVPHISQYRDRRFTGSQEDFEECLRISTTLYIGNLSFYTTEDQIYEVFSRCGDIKRIIMGLDKQRCTPCGFCFVVYYTREDTEDAVKYLNGTTLDDRPIRVDFDWGFREDRQFGRGRSGGQVRDEYRMDFDSGRGGYGQVFKQELSVRMTQHMGQYLEGQDDEGAVGNKRRRLSSGRSENPRFREQEDVDEDGDG